jgi:hypothetical protein
MFGTTGWLFADLMLALALAFIVATTVGQPSPPGSNDGDAKLPPTTTSTAPTTSAAAYEPVLELTPVPVKLTVDWQRLLNNDAATAEGLRGQMRSNSQFSGRRAGLVLTFGGTSNGKAAGRGISIANQVNDILRGLDAPGSAFRSTTVYRPFISFDPPEILNIDVYLFK